MRRAMLAVLVAGCASDLPARVESPPLPARTPLPEMHIAWVRDDWRICHADECPRPTPKTVAYAMELPPLAMELPPLRLPAEKPVPAPREYRVGFVFGKATPTVSGKEVLKQALAALSRLQDGDVIRIEGYTDSTGPRRVNDILARKRAEYVAAWLKRQGIRNPVELSSQGKCCYVADNRTAEGRAQNRRAVIILKAVGEVR